MQIANSPLDPASQHSVVLTINVWGWCFWAVGSSTDTSREGYIVFSATAVTGSGSWNLCMKSSGRRICSFVIPEDKAVRYKKGRGWLSSLRSWSRTFPPWLVARGQTPDCLWAIPVYLVEFTCEHRMLLSTFAAQNDSELLIPFNSSAFHLGSRLK